MEAILSNNTRKLLWFEITKMLIAASEKNYCIIYYNFRHTFVLYWLAAAKPGRLFANCSVYSRIGVDAFRTNRALTATQYRSRVA